MSGLDAPLDIPDPIEPSEPLVIEQLRLPCYHVIDLPARLNVTLTCPHDNRIWNVYKKGVEWLAQEQFTPTNKGN